MSYRRLVFVYALLVGLFFIGVCRVYTISQNKSYANKAKNQTVTTLTLEAPRGNFYDCEGAPLTGQKKRYYALCVPGEENYAKLFGYVDEAGQRLLYQKRNAAAPFLIRVSQDLNAEGIYTYTAQERYEELPLCVHLLGYLGSDGHGVAGLEAAFDEQLSGSGDSYLQCVTNAQGRLMKDTKPIRRNAQAEGTDVQLAIDAKIQAACEGIADGMMTTGCILVLDTQSAEVRACVSVPGFDPNRVSAALSSEGSPLLNRAFSAYAVGSVFKPVLAAAALEEDKSALTIRCEGYTKVSDHIYRCAGGAAHGDTDLSRALQKSCNCYFIALGQQLGAAVMYRYAQEFGFGQPIYLAGGLKAAAGNLPDTAVLEDLGQKANFSFGQGELLATPLQIAAMMNTIAAGGEYRVPRFLLRTFDSDTGKTVETLSGEEARRVISEENAKTLREMLAEVISRGLGKEAQPTYGDAAGKTGTAQTGRRSAAGEEYKNLWFAGFYPAQNPAYTVVVMQDDQTKAANSSAAVFARVCDALALLKQNGTIEALRTAESS